MSPPKVELIATRDNIAELLIDGRTVFVPYIVQGAQVSFKFEGETYSVDGGEKTSRARHRHRDHSMSAPMPGVERTAGDEGNTPRDSGSHEDGARHFGTAGRHNRGHQLQGGGIGTAGQRLD
jgi:hypothetical protein